MHYIRSFRDEPAMVKVNSLSRRALLSSLPAFAGLLGGYVPSERAFAQALTAAELRTEITNPLEMWLYTLDMPPEFPSTWAFGYEGAPAIPGGFFDTNSDPWVGTIRCVGVPLEPQGHTPTADLVVRHEAVEWIPNPNLQYGPREIPKTFRIRCDMMKLHERMPDPIVVTYGNGQHQDLWNVVVTISKKHPGGGHIDIAWLNEDGSGGLCNIEIAVKVDFTFTNLTNQRQVVLSSKIEWLSETNHNFARFATPAASRLFNISPGADGRFIPSSRILSGEIVPTASKSCSSTVAHSFALAPLLLPAVPGSLLQILQFPQRKE
jgi:hypothetical protein